MLGTQNPEPDAEHRRAHTLILALGSPLRGDDGVGLAVLDALRRHPLPPHVVLVDGGTSGLELVLTMQGCQRVIAIDAAQMGALPGTWRRFTLDEVRLQARDPHLGGTLHYVGFAEALLLAEALGMLPPTIVMFGVQPQELGWRQGLSEPVQAAVEPLAQAIFDLIADGAQP